jgi:hypothetical protein
MLVVRCRSQWLRELVHSHREMSLTLAGKSRTDYCAAVFETFQRRFRGNVDTSAAAGCHIAAMVGAY